MNHELRLPDRVYHEMVYSIPSQWREREFHKHCPDQFFVKEYVRDSFLRSVNWYECMRSDLFEPPMWIVLCRDSGKETPSGFQCFVDSFDHILHLFLRSVMDDIH